jgi:hypothetical protein
MPSSFYIYSVYIRCLITDNSSTCSDRHEGTWVELLQFTTKKASIDTILNIIDNSRSRRGREVRSLVTELKRSRNIMALRTRRIHRAHARVVGSTDRLDANIGQRAFRRKCIQALLDQGVIGSQKLLVGCAAGSVQRGGGDASGIDGSKAVGDRRQGAEDWWRSHCRRSTNWCCGGANWCCGGTNWCRGGANWCCGCSSLAASPGGNFQDASRIALLQFAIQITGVDLILNLLDHDGTRFGGEVRGRVCERIGCRDVETNRTRRRARSTRLHGSACQLDSSKDQVSCHRSIVGRDNLFGNRGVTTQQLLV